MPQYNMGWVIKNVIFGLTMTLNHFFHITLDQKSCRRVKIVSFCICISTYSDAVFCSIRTVVPWEGYVWRSPFPREERAGESDICAHQHMFLPARVHNNSRGLRGWSIQTHRVRNTSLHGDTHLKKKNYKTIKLDMWNANDNYNSKKHLWSFKSQQFVTKDFF